MIWNTCDEVTVCNEIRQMRMNRTKSRHEGKETTRVESRTLMQEIKEEKGTKNKGVV